jgi:hypothetical protein
LYYFVESNTGWAGFMDVQSMSCVTVVIINLFRLGGLDRGTCLNLENTQKEFVADVFGGIA